MKPRRILSAARLSLPFASALVALFSAHSAQGQTTRYWDGNDSAANFGSASGTWAAPTTGTATAGWSASSAGTAVVLANSITTLINDPLNFGRDTTGTGLGSGTITVSGTVNAASLRFGSLTTGNITLSGGTINLAAVTTIHVGAGSTTVHTISSAITGAGTSLTKTGNSLTLSGANTYVGSTIISSGTLTLNNLSAVGSTSGITIGGAAAATLASSLTGITITAPITTANSGVNSNISFGRGTAAVGSLTLNGAIGGAGNVIFTTPNVSSGGNLQTINLGSTVNNYTGSTTITTGNVNNTTSIKNTSAAANALPVSTVLNLNGGNGTGSGRTVTYDLNGQAQTLAGLTNSISALTARNQRVSNTGALATLTIDGSTDSTYGGLGIGSFFNGAAVNPSAQIVGAIALTKKGTGTFTLAAGSGNGFTGKTVVEGGILSLGHPTSIQSSAFDTTNSISGDATNGLRTTVTTLTMAGLTGNKDLASVFTTTSGGYDGLTALTLNPGTGVTHSYDANIVDGATGMNLIKAGVGTHILTGTNTYSGTTTGSAGLLLTTKAAALSGYNVAGKVVFTGGTIGVQVGGSGWTTGEVDTLLANATKISGALGIDTTSGNLIQWTPFTTNFGSLGLNKLGVNDLTLNQANTYTGTTTVTAGTLTLANALALQNSPLNISGGSVVLSGLTTLNLGGLNGSGALDWTGLTHLTLNAPAGALLSYSGIIGDGTGMTVTKTGPGVQTLTGANTYTGATQIDGGILTFGNKAAKINTAAAAAAAGSIGLGVKAADPAFYSEIEVGDLFNTNTLAGFVLDAASGVAIDTTNAGGSFDQTVALTAARSLSKTGTGTLVLSQINTYSGSTSILAGTLSLTGSLDGGGAVSTSGAGVLSQTSTGLISGAATVTQGSTGASSLAGTNTYTGVTTVNLGQLTISNAAALGTIDGNTIVASGGRLAMATASLSVAEPLTITGTGTTATNGALAFAGGVTGMALTGPITLGGAARIQADGSTGSTLSGGISLGANVLTINTDGGATQTINTTAITGTDGSLVKSGSGTLVLGVANSYTGATTVNLGTLSITHNDALGTTAVATTINGGNGINAVSLSLSDATSDLVVAEPLNFLGNTAGRAQLVNNSAQNHTVSGPISVSSDTNVSQFSSSGDGSITVSGDITGTFTNGASFFLRGTSTANNRVTGSLNLTGANLGKTDAGTWTVGALGETYSWTDTQLAVGTLGMGAASVLPSAALLLMGNTTGASTPTLDLNGFSQTVAGITYAGQGVATGTRTITSATPATLTVNNATDFINTGTNVSTNNVVLTGALSLTKQGAGTLALNGVNTYIGDTVVDGGTLVLADNAQLKFVLSSASGDNNDLTGAGTVTLDGDFVIDTTAADALATGTWTLENVSTAAYGATFSVVGFTDAGGNKWTKANGPTAYTFDETTGILTLGAAGYSSWASTNGTLQTIDLDHDGDGVQNGVEYFLGGPTGNTTGFTPLPGVTNTLGVLSVTWIKGSGYQGAYGTDFTVETSSTLTGVWVPADPGTAAGQADATTTPGQVKFTFPAGTRNFVRLKVTGP